MKDTSDFKDETFTKSDWLKVRNAMLHYDEMRLSLKKLEDLLVGDHLMKYPESVRKHFEDIFSLNKRIEKAHIR